MNTIAKFGLPLIGAVLGFSVATQAQLQVKLENNTNASNFSYDNGNVRIGTAGYSAYDLSISNPGTSRLAFMHTGTGENGVIEYSASNQFRFQRYLNGGWQNTTMTVDIAQQRVGVKTDSPNETLHVNGTVGIGKFSDQNTAGLSISYADAGSGITKFTHNRWGGTATWARGSSQGELKQIEFGGNNGHFLSIYDNNNTAQISLASNGTSFFDGDRLVIGAKTLNNPGNIFEVQGNMGIGDGHLLSIGGETTGGGGVRFYNVPSAKLTTIDYSENFYIRRAVPGNNQGAVMGFQGDGTVTIGIWEKTDGTYDGTGAHKLMVKGSVLCEKLVVSDDVPNSDHVFEEEYDLKSLNEVEAFITENKHLPEIPSAQEFKDNGYSVGEMDDLLLRKVEELTLYIIAQQKQIDELTKQQQ